VSLDGVRFAFDVLILINHLAGTVFQTKSHDHAMHGCIAASFVVPTERAVRKVNMNALRQQPAPKYADLFALGDAVGRNKCATGLLGRALTPTLSQRERA
jgi:hypothetical protein